MTNDFGSVVINTNSGAASFTITNTGEATSGSITPVVTGAAAADFTATNGCTTLAGGGTCVVTVVFRPATAGVKNANLVVSGSPGGSAMATLVGTGQTPGTLTITPSSLAFGNQVNGTPTASQTFTVTNTGTIATTALTVTKAGTNPADFVKGADTCNTMTLAGGGSCTIAVTFNPTSAGPKAASFVINAATGGSVNGAVTGTGLDPARLVVIPAFQDFGSVTTGQSSGNIDFTVTNTGDVATSAITDAFLAPNGGEFSRVSTTCATLTADATCTIVVRFTPATVGAKSTTLSVTATTGGTSGASLVGTAVAPGNLSISPTPHTFADTTVGQVSATQIFTVTNTGGSATDAFGAALAGTDPSHFTLVAGGNGCQGVVLAPSGTCTIALNFTPTSGGLKSATLAVSHTGGSTTAAVSGTGIAPAQFTLTPMSFDFGSVVTTTTSSPQNFVLTNVGGQISGVPSFAINGANASEFAVNATGCPAALASGDNCTVQVSFSPVTAGAKAASLDVTGTGGPASSALSGNGISNAALAVNPSIINFPVTLIGDSATVENFTVTNNGSVDTGNLTITVIPAGEYTQTNNCTDGAGPGVDFLTPGASCVVTVTFAPTSPGLRSATVQVSGAPGGTVGTAVNGNALAKLEIETPVPVTFPINMHTFPNSIVDPDAPFTVQVTLRNNNLAAAAAVTEVQTFDGNFTLVSAPCTTIAAGDVCVATYAYTPQTISTHTGNVIFTATGGGAGNTARQNFSGTSNLLTLKITDAFGAQLTGPPADTTPTSHAFGNRAVGTSSSLRTFRVTNEGNMPTGILAVDLSGAGFQIESNGCSGIALADNASCDIAVVFTPTAQAAQMATITVRTSQGAPFLGGTVTATLSGTGTAPTPLANPTAVDFGTLFAGDTVVANTDEVVVITNPNAVATNLTFTLTDDPLDGTQFSLVNAATNPCDGTLAAGASCNRGIRLTPALPAGARTGNLQVSSSVGAISVDVPLTGAVRSTLSLVAALAPFMNQVINTSSSQTLTVRNDSPDQTVATFTVTAGGAPYFILNNTCTSLAPGATCTFDLQFSPTTAPTSFLRLLTITGGTTGSAVTTVNGNSITAANVVVSPATQAFGSEITGQNGSSQTFTFTNLGQQTSGAMAVALASTANFSIQANACTTTLAFNASCDVTVRFNPTEVGVVVTTLTGTATPGGAPAAALTGTGIAPGGVRVSPTAFVFNNTTAGQLSAPQDFTVQNTSTVSPAALTNVTTAEFAVVAVGTTCTATLAAGASCIVRVQFAPASAGAKVGTLTVSGPTVAALSGRALTVANVTANVGGVFSNPTTITINDSGTPSVPEPSDIVVTGVSGAVSSLRVTLTGYSHTFPADVDIMLVAPNGARLTLMSDVGGGGDVVGQTYTIDDAAAALFPTGTLSSGSFQPTDRVGGIDNWAIGGATDAAPEGTGTIANTLLGSPANGTWSLYVRDNVGADVGSISGGWSIEIGNTAFANQTINTSSGLRAIQLTNNGQTQATALTGAIGGADFSHFTITDGCNGVALQPGMSCNLLVAFSPTTTGNKVATVTYTGPSTIPLMFSGLAVNPALLSITPSVVQNDGNRAIGDIDTAATVFTISNSIGQNTTSAITFTPTNGANYTLSQADSTCQLDGSQTLAPGTSCTVGVLFNPTQLGTQNGGFMATATAGGTVSGLMAGFGQEALINTTVSPVVYANAAPGSVGSQQTITFRNRSDVPTTLVQTTLTNTLGSDFSIISDDCGGQSIAPNTDCTITARFVPSGAAGARAATLQVQAVVTGTTTTASVTLQANTL